MSATIRCAGCWACALVIQSWGVDHASRQLTGDFGCCNQARSRLRSCSGVPYLITTMHEM